MSKIKGAFLCVSISRLAGGVAPVVRRVAQTLQSCQNAEIDVFALQDGHSDEDLPEWQPLEPRVFRSSGPGFFRWSREMVSALRSGGYDFIHLHGLWQFPSIAALKSSSAMEIPRVISPHGMMDSWALSQSRWKKRLAGLFFEDANLRGASCLHALSSAETDALRQYGLPNPVAVIPNGTDLPSGPPKVPPPWKGVIPDDSRIMLFLGRLHPKKGLPNLIQAWGSLAKNNSTAIDNWHLAVIGWDQQGHETEMKSAVIEAGLDDRIHFLGPQFGESKEAALDGADAFILPSFSEGLPMAILEAWSYSLPVLMTSECNLPSGFESKAALEIRPESDSMVSKLEEFFSLPDSDRIEMGENGKALVERRFSWEIVASQMRAVYDWLLEREEKPEFVESD